MLRLIKKNTIMCYYKTYKDNNGYPRFKTTNILVHRLVASKKLGRDLLPGEIVHHINRNKSDNRPSNLWIFKNQYQHDWIHKKDAFKFGWKISYQGF